MKNKKSRPSRHLKSSRFSRSTFLIFALVFAVIGGYALLKSFAVSAPSLYVTPDSGSYNQGDSMTIAIYEDSGSDTVNAVQANLTYPNSLLTVSSITSSSAFSIDAQSQGGNGTVKIARGTTTPVSGAQLVATVKFTVTAGGTANINFDTNSSAVVRSTDNQNEALNYQNGTYSLVASTTNPPPPPPPPASPPPPSGSTTPPSKPSSSKPSTSTSSSTPSSSSPAATSTTPTATSQQASQLSTQPTAAVSASVPGPKSNINTKWLTIAGSAAVLVSVLCWFYLQKFEGLVKHTPPITMATLTPTPTPKVSSGALVIPGTLPTPAAVKPNIVKPQTSQPPNQTASQPKTPPKT